MGLFFGNNKNIDDTYDYERLRRDLVEEYAIQSAAFSGGLGAWDMFSVQDASEQKLLEYARREGFNLKKYKK